jgi:hypothetical protein
MNKCSQQCYFWTLGPINLAHMIMSEYRFHKTKMFGNFFFKNEGKSSIKNQLFRSIQI